MQKFFEKLGGVLTSRKFFVLLAALATVGAMWDADQITAWQAVQAVIAATSVYATGVAIEDGLSRSK